MQAAKADTIMNKRGRCVVSEQRICLFLERLKSITVEVRQRKAREARKRRKAEFSKITFIPLRR